MSIVYNKHYIRLCDNNVIIKGFSDAYESPTELDICINEQGGRQFQINGSYNTDLKTMDGAHLYKYVNETIVETTQEERTAELVALPAPIVPPSLEERLEMVETLLIELTM